MILATQNFLGRHCLRLGTSLASPNRHSRAGGNLVTLQWALRLRHDATSEDASFKAPMEKCPCVYVLASDRNGTLYIGVTSDLEGRVSVHIQDLVPGFTAKHRVHRLVYYEMHETMEAAIAREKQLKKWNRLWKLRLIESANPEWLDLFDRSNGTVLDLPADSERRQS